MIWLFWILFMIFLGFFVYFIIRIKKMSHDQIHNRWGRVYTDNIIIDKIQIITPENQKLKGYYYTSTDFTDSDIMPGVIVIPRRDKKYPFFEHWGAHFALQGYPTLCVEVYEKKLGIDEFITKYRKIMPIIKKRFSQFKRVDKSKLIYFGAELSGKVAILEGLLDEDVKSICGISVPRIEVNEIKNKGGNQKIYLVHCKDDEIVPIKDFNHNKEIFGLGDTDYILYDYGGHHIISQEPSTAAFFSIKIKKDVNPVYKQFTKEVDDNP